MRILFVEDEPDTRRLLGHGLQHYGFNVTFAEDGVTAVQALREHAFDVVLTDFSMPNGVTGIEVANHVRQLHPAARIIIASGYARSQLPALPEGVEYLAKPYRLTELVSILKVGSGKM